MNEISNLKKQIDNLTIKSEGIRLEYEFVNSLKEKRIKELKEIVDCKEKEKEFYKKESEEAAKKTEEYKKELEQIKNSRWWKLRNKIKGEK